MLELLVHVVGAAAHVGHARLGGDLVEVEELGFGHDDVLVSCERRGGVEDGDFRGRRDEIGEKGFAEGLGNAFGRLASVVFAEFGPVANGWRRGSSRHNK